LNRLLVVVVFYSTQGYLLKLVITVINYCTILCIGYNLSVNENSHIS